MSGQPFGSWASPLGAEAVVAAGVGLGGPVVADDGAVWWSESRPDEGGRIQLVRRDRDGTVAEVLPDGWSARTRVHEYGGGAWWPAAGTVFFAAWADQRLHRLDVGDGWGSASIEPVALTPEPVVPGGDRYADGVVTPDGRWVLCVRERHPSDGGEARNEIVAVRATPGADGPVEPAVVVDGHDFVSHPRIDPSGCWLSWLAWDHPRMPWDGTELSVADLTFDGPDRAPVVRHRTVVLGGPDVSVAQPSWAPDGRLVAVADADDWWNLWSAAGPGRPEPGSFTQRSVVDGELAQPQWVFGQSWYGHRPDGTIVGSWRFDGTDHLGVLALDDVVPRWLDLPTTATLGIDVGVDGLVAVVAASFTSEAEVAILHLDGDRAVDGPGDAGTGSPGTDVDGPDGDRPEAQGPGERGEPGRSDLHAPAGAWLEVLRPARELGVDAGWWSVAEAITFPTTGERTAHALWYPPHSPEVTGPGGTAPPVLVLGHGGPTSAARPQLDLAVQYWTTRGWGVLDVNYGGSTGYGRPFRRRLDGQWGVVDVDDLCAAAEHLAGRGLADPERLAIKGGSAGGFTVLAALAFRDVFAVGASRYGIADLEALATETHKFESRYTDGLVAPYPEGRDLYVERSPIHHLESFDTPLLVLQGLLDEVVPPNQAEMIVAALEAKGVPVAYVTFPDEAHGFRSAEAILSALQAEHYVLSEVLGIATADELPVVEIRRP